MTATGATVGENLAGLRPAEDGETSSSRWSDPIHAEGGLAILRGNLAPSGAVIKHAAASPQLLQHRGRAVVFGSLQEMIVAVNDPDLDVTPDDILVMQNAGPVGGPGHAGGRLHPNPQEAAAARSAGHGADFRCSDERNRFWHDRASRRARRPLSADRWQPSRTGDTIELDVPNRQLNLLVPRRR